MLRTMLARAALGALLSSAVVGTAEAKEPSVAIGAKRGDGMGNSPGVDVAFPLVQNLYLGMAAYALLDAEGRGLALAPALQWRMYRTLEGPVPYLSGGVNAQVRRYGSRTATGTGVFATVGIEWLFGFGISLRGGLGVQVQQAVQVEDGPVTIEQPGYVSLFMDGGVRYWF